MKGHAFFAACLLAALTLFAGRPVLAADRLTVMLDWLPNPDQAPLFVAQHIGTFARYGLDVTLVAPSDTSTPAMMAATGRVDIAITYQPQLYLLVSKGVPLLRFATLVDTPLDSIIALKDGPVHGLADLKGKTLGFAVPGVEEALAHAMLVSAGVQPSDVRMVNVNFQIVSALMSHQVDATISAYRNKEIHELNQHGLQAVSFYPEEHGVPPYDELIYVVRRDAAHDARLQRFVSALRDSTAWLLDHPDEAWSGFIHDHPEQDNSLIKTEWFDTLRRFDKAPGLLDRLRYDRFGRFMQQQGLIPEAIGADRIAVQTEEAGP